MEEKLYTPEDLSKILQLSKYTIYEMIKRGDISAHHIGKSIRVSQFQLDQYLVGARKAENVFFSEIVLENGDALARISGVPVYVSTEITGPARVCIAPEDIILSLTDLKCSARNVLPGTVREIIADDREAKLLADVGFPLLILITKKSLDSMNIKNGDQIFAVFKALSVKVIKA